VPGSAPPNANRAEQKQPHPRETPATNGETVPPGVETIAPGGGTNTPPNEPPRWRGQEAVIAERRVKALELRKGGASYRQIAAVLLTSLETAYNDVQAEMQALRDLALAGAEDIRDLERQRLDRSTAAMTAIADNPARTPLERIKATATLVRIMERRAKLEGYDAPKRVEVSGHVDTTATLTTIDLDALDEAQLLALRDIALAQEAAAAAALP
jgi:hypothetical protein